MSTHLTRHFHSPFPALNISRRHEYVATNTIYADTPSTYCVHTRAQFYRGINSQVCDIYGMRADKQLINSVEDIIRQRRAIDRLISDHAQLEISGRVLDILRTYVIRNWNSEPHQ